jgi:hypothetical protein
LKAETFLDLLLRLVADQGTFTHRCHETPVGAAMTTPAVTVTDDAEFREIEPIAKLPVAVEPNPGEGRELLFLAPCSVR